MVFFVKKIFIALFFLAKVSVYGQEELHIHHINIGNGDATLIGIFDLSQQKYVSKMLIDGGRLTAEKRLLPYIHKIIGADSESLHFQYVILSHYHNDHYTGLLALKSGRITADSIIDPGGYRVSSLFNHTATGGRKPDSLKIYMPWLDSLKDAARHNPPFVKGRSLIFLRYTTTPTTSIAKKLVFGQVNGMDVTLQCVAGWGNTLSENGVIVANPFPKRPNGNNFTLAFVLSLGEFRYFIGGDIGGAGGNYINQETVVTKFLNDEYPTSFSWSGNTPIKGHLCGYKSNHHGSDHSNNSGFMEGMRPTVVVTSAGDNSVWHLPHPNSLRRLSRVVPITDTLGNDIFSRGLYFTNLFNFSDIKSKDTAIKLFKNKPGISFDFGNNTNTAEGSYLIKVKDQSNNQSSFEVGRIDLDSQIPYKKLGVFFCHKK